MSTSTEEPQPSTLSSPLEHGPIHRLVPDGPDPAVPWRCISPGCDYYFSDFRAAELARDFRATLVLHPTRQEEEHGDDCPRCEKDTAACYCTGQPTPEPDCAQCDHPSDAHSGERSECREQRDGEDCDCGYYFPKDDDPDEPDVTFERRPGPEPKPPVRPPYAVAYGASGQLYEVVVPGDAAVSAIDGKLVIEHPGLSVLGIVRTMPWPPPAAEGGPDGPDTEGSAR